MSDDQDPLLGFRFQVDFGAGASEMGFMKVSGLQVDIDEYAWEEISDTVTAFKLPGIVKFSDLSLERGAIRAVSPVWRWFREVEEALKTGRPTSMRRTLTIRLQEKGMSDPEAYALEWQVFAAFPKTIKYGELDATSSAVFIESLTLANEGIRLLHQGI